MSCSSVHVEGVSKGTYSRVFGDHPTPVESNTTNIRVSNDRSTFQLTCNRDDKDCVEPTVGEAYTLATFAGEKPVELQDNEGEYPHLGRLALLKQGNVTLGPYWIAAQLPVTSPRLFQQLLAECSAREQGINENDCAKWLSRKAQLKEMACPDPSSQSACQSFQELLDSSDADILDLLARVEHVYICFRPQEDEFFAVFHGEPIDTAWIKPDDQELKLFDLVKGSLMQFSIPGVFFYKKGLIQPSEHIEAVGAWGYFPLTHDTTASTLARVATSSDAKFKSKDLRINGTRIAVSETYESMSRKHVKHTLDVQRSTGRYREEYTYSPSGGSLSSYDGHCLIAPNATN